jgi:hypothetical protein
LRISSMSLTEKWNDRICFEKKNFYRHFHIHSSRK